MNDDSLNDADGGDDHDWVWLEFQRSLRESPLYASHASHRRLFDAVAERVRRVSLSEGLPHYDFESRLREASELVRSIIDALAGHPPDEADTRGRNYDSRWRADGRPSPVDGESLEECAGRYLARQWMQTDCLDWALINGFLFDALAAFRSDVLSGEFFGRINWTYAFADRDPTRTVVYKALSSLLVWLARWLIVPGALWVLAAKTGWVSVNYVGLAYAGYLVLHLMLLPGRILRSRREGRVAAAIDKRLLLAFDTSRSPTYSPSLLREELLELRRMEGGANRVRPVVYALLERTIQRDPALLSRIGG